MGLAIAEDVAPQTVISPSVGLAQPVIVLSPTVHTISLDRLSRFWIDAGAVRGPDQMEASGDSLPWAIRQPDSSYRIDGKALWFQFDALNEGDNRWYLELASSGIDRAQLFFRSAAGQWIEQEAGDTKPVSLWPLPGRLPTFEMAGKADKPVRYWLRIEHERVDFETPISIRDSGSLL